MERARRLLGGAHRHVGGRSLEAPRRTAQFARIQIPRGKGFDALDGTGGRASRPPPLPLHPPAPVRRPCRLTPRTLVRHLCGLPAPSRLPPLRPCGPLSEATADHVCSFPLRSQMYREGDVVHLVYVARALKPPIEVFHGMPGTAYTFSQPGQHHEVVDIETARRTILHRFLPILQKKNIKYELHLYAENAEASSSKVAEAIIRAGAEDVQPDLVVLAAHNKARGPPEPPGPRPAVARAIGREREGGDSRMRCRGYPPRFAREKAVARAGTWRDARATGRAGSRAFVSSARDLHSSYFFSRRPATAGRAAWLCRGRIGPARSAAPSTHRVVRTTARRCSPAPLAPVLPSAFESLAATSPSLLSSFVSAHARSLPPAPYFSQPATDKYMGALGGVTRQLISSCTLPLVIIHPEVTA